MNKKGFTLVELLAVIAILAILVIIAMPNVLEMFNKAKQDAFETEVKTHVKAVSNQFITTGKLVYSNVVDGAAKLPMDGEELDYYIELDSQGNIKELNVTNGDYKIEATGTSQNPIKVEQIGDTIKSETAESGEEFAMNSNGDITGGSSNNGGTNDNNLVYNAFYTDYNGNYAVKLGKNGTMQYSTNGNDLFDGTYTYENGVINAIGMEFKVSCNGKCLDYYENGELVIELKIYNWLFVTTTSVVTEYNNTDYKYPDGMTWNEFVVSKYNNNTDFKIINGLVYSRTNVFTDYLKLKYSNGKEVKSSDTIISSDYETYNN